MENGDIFANKETLNEDFTPNRPICRESKIQELERFLVPALKKGCADNFLLVGPSGTGKTAVIKWIFENNFRERSAYVNCWKQRTTHEVLMEILSILQIPVHGREPTGSLNKMIERVVKKRKIIVCLDEVDRLKNLDVLYILARYGCGLILISTSANALAHVTGRIKSSLVLTEIMFPSYTTDELQEILQDRVETAFRHAAFCEKLIKIAAKAADGDARIGLKIIRKAGKKAQTKRLSAVTKFELEQAIAEAHRLELVQPSNDFNAHQVIICQILRKNGTMKSGPLYKEYSKAVGTPVVERTYRKYMENMVKLGIVECERKGRWKSYRIVW